jgi:hypothetical protein
MILASRAFIEDEKVVRRHRALSLALIILLAPIIASAALRMNLYVGYFGLTADRLYASALMAWLAFVFVALARTVLRGWSRPFASMAMLSGFATLFALNILNPDLLVARVNLGRATAAQPVDYAYLARLDGDALPTVVKSLSSAAPSVDACNAAESIRKRWSARPASWNLGAQRGRQAVADDLTLMDVQRLCAGVPVPVSPPATPG